jgi:hypothetical protein
MRVFGQNHQQSLNLLARQIIFLRTTKAIKCGRTLWKSIRNRATRRNSAVRTSSTGMTTTTSQTGNLRVLPDCGIAPTAPVALAPLDRALKGK